jgi:hypothetical protein
MSSNDTPESGQPLVFGVPGSTVAAALRGAGLDEDAVVAVLSRAVARSAVAAADASAAGDQGFTFQVGIAETASECALSYQRLFVHPDFIDGVTVVQAGQTPDEIGFNSRFHSIEGEFDSIARDLSTSSNCLAELRRELYLMARELEAKITEMDARIAAKGKDKDTKEGKETKEAKDTKDTKEKDTKEGKDKEGKDHKDGKDKDHIDKVAALEKLSQIENTPLQAEVRDAPATPPTEAPAGSARTFITLEDRPDVEAAALRDDETPPVEPGTPEAGDTPGGEPAATAAEPAEPAPAAKAPANKAAAKRPAPRKAAAKKTPGAAEKATPPPRRRRRGGRGSAEPTDG